MNKLFSTLSKEELETIAPTEAEDTTDQGDGTAELEEGLEAKAEYEATADAVDAAVEELENLQEKDQMLAEAEESDDPAKQAAAVAVANEALRGACQRIGMDYEKYNVTFESLNLNADIKLAREGIGDTLKKGWEAVKKGLIAAWEFVLKYIKKFLGFFGIKFKNSEKKEKENKEKADELKQKSTKLPPEEKKAVDTLVGAATGLVPFRAKELQEVIDAVIIEPGDNKLAGPADKKLIEPANKPLLLPPPEVVKEALSKVDDPLLNINSIQDTILSGFWYGGDTNIDRIISRLSKVVSLIGKNEISDIISVFKVVNQKANLTKDLLAKYEERIRRLPGHQELVKINNKAIMVALAVSNFENGSELKSLENSDNMLITKAGPRTLAVYDVMDTQNRKEFTLSKSVYNEVMEKLLELPIAKPGSGIATISQSIIDDFNKIYNKAEDLEKSFQSLETYADKKATPDVVANLTAEQANKNAKLRVIKATSSTFVFVLSQILQAMGAVDEIHWVQLNAASNLLKAAEKIVNNSKKAA